MAFNVKIEYVCQRKTAGLEPLIITGHTSEVNSIRGGGIRSFIDDNENIKTIPETYGPGSGTQKLNKVYYRGTYYKTENDIYLSELNYSDFEYNGDDDLTIKVYYSETGEDNFGPSEDELKPSEPSNPSEDIPMVVTFNYYVNGILVDDTKFEQIELDMGRPIDEIWPRTLECYHIRFDKINPTEDSNPGTSGSTLYNSLEFTYIDEENYGNSWPSSTTLTNTKLIGAFSNTYFSKYKCVTINGIEYQAGENFTQNPTFHSVNTKTLEVNLYYTAVQVSTTVRTYNRDSSVYNIEKKINEGIYLNKDLWGYTCVGLNHIDYLQYTHHKIIYDVPLTSGYEVICCAAYKSGFEFVKWVNTSDVEEIHAKTTANSEERQSEIDKLPALKDETGNENDRDTGAILHLNAYENHDVTAIFRPVKNEVKLYKGLDFYGSDTYYIWGGDNKWKNSGNSDVNITIPTREGAKLLGWIGWKTINSDYLTIKRSEFNEILSGYLATKPNSTEAYISTIEQIINTNEDVELVLRIDGDIDGDNRTITLVSGSKGFTDSQGNWLTGDKNLYPLWLVEEYPIKYKSYEKESLVVDETIIDTDEGKFYNLSPSDYSLKSSYTILDDIEFPVLEKQPNIDFPVYYSFDKWEPSEIKKFTKTGEQTIVAHWVLDTYKITLEKNNNYANQSVKIKIGQSTFVGDEKVKAPTTRTAYKSFEGWYTENNIYTNNGCDIIGKLIINKDGVLQPNVEGYTDSEGKWIKEENTTVYAKWTPEKYIITYHLEGISNPLEGNLNPIKHTYTIEDTKVKITNSGSASFTEVLENGLPLLDSTELNPPTGKSLDGWYTNANYTGTKKQYLEKGSYGDKTFYGIYKTAEYTIEYDNIREETCINYEKLPKKHIYGTETTLVDPSFLLYDFLGWYTDANFENPITSIPANYNGNSTIKLYAKLALKAIPIYYKDSEGNDIDDSLFNETPPRFHTYGEETILVNAYKNGYTFDGWYNNIECTGDIITSLGPEDYTGFATVYCKFIPVEYTIEYYVDGVETTIDGNPSKYTIEDVPIILNNPQDKPGYNSIGWIKNSQDYGAIVKEITTLGDFKLYWCRTPKVITITWDPNGGSVSHSSDQYTYDWDNVVPPTPTRTGYEFDGWYTSKSGGTKITEVGINNKPTEDVTYYAHWNNGTGVKYTVKHCKQALDGTYLKDDNLIEIEEYYGTTGDNISPEVKEYIGFTSPSPVFAQITPNGTTVVEYKYTRNKYTISWDANGGETLTGDYTNGSVYYETPIVAPNDPIKVEYTFTGWTSSVTEISEIPEKMPAYDITFTASYEYEILDITPVAVDFTLETVEANKIATNKWLHNVLGEPEKTSWGDLSNIFKTDFGSSITGECVTVSDLNYFITTQSLYECKKQNEVATIFSYSPTSSSLKQNKYYELLKMNSKLGSIEFKVTPVASTSNVPNYPGTDGFIMYFSVGSNPKLYKATIPVNKVCRMKVRAVSSNDVLAIHRIPCYYGNSTYKIIVPIIYMTNNNSNVHKLYSNTVLLQQALNR